MQPDWELTTIPYQNFGSGYWLSFGINNINLLKIQDKLRVSQPSIFVVFCQEYL